MHNHVDGAPHRLGRRGLQHVHVSSTCYAPRRRIDSYVMRERTPASHQKTRQHVGRIIGTSPQRKRVASTIAAAAALLNAPTPTTRDNTADTQKINDRKTIDNGRYVHRLWDASRSVCVYVPATKRIEIMNRYGARALSRPAATHDATEHRSIAQHRAVCVLDHELAVVVVVVVARPPVRLHVVVFVGAAVAYSA